MKNAYAGGGEDFFPSQQQFDHFVNVAQQQMQNPISWQNFNEYAQNDGWFDALLQLIETMPTNILWLVTGIMGIGVVTTGIVAWRIARKHPWFKELLKMWKVSSGDRS